LFFLLINEDISYLMCLDTKWCYWNDDVRSWRCSIMTRKQHTTRLLPAWKATGPSLKWSAILRNIPFLCI